MQKNHKSWQRPQFSKADKQLAAILAAPDVDEKAADEHIKNATAEIQAEWSETERRQRRGIKTIPGVDIECKTGDYWSKGLRGVRQQHGG